MWKIQTGFNDPPHFIKPPTGTGAGAGAVSPPAAARAWRQRQGQGELRLRILRSTFHGHSIQERVGHRLSGRRNPEAFFWNQAPIALGPPLDWRVG